MDREVRASGGDRTRSAALRWCEGRLPVARIQFPQSLKWKTDVSRGF